MFTYSQRTGELAQNGEFVGTGYSGNGPGRNNPDMQAVHNVGPIPEGEYTIGLPYADPARGPCVMRLTPSSDTNEFGRSGFLIHGDNKTHTASEGCIILGPTIRQFIANSGDTVLTVVRG